MIIILIAVVIIGFILAIIYVERDRAEIQRKQEALEWANHILLTKLKAEELRRHKEMLEKEYNPQV